MSTVKSSWWMGRVSNGKWRMNNDLPTASFHSFNLFFFWCFVFPKPRLYTSRLQLETVRGAFVQIPASVEGLSSESTPIKNHQPQPTHRRSTKLLLLHSNLNCTETTTTWKLSPSIHEKIHLYRPSSFDWYFGHLKNPTGHMIAITFQLSFHSACTWSPSLIISKHKHPVLENPLLNLKVGTEEREEISQVWPIHLDWRLQPFLDYF